MEKKLITVWERRNRRDDGSWVWEHNHISNGYSEAPVGKFSDQIKGWKGGEWRSFKAYLIEGKVEQVEHGENV